jgi:hypothetical protein
MASDDQGLDVAIQFARHNFDNHQALIRSSDAKAGVMVTVVVFLAASALQVSKEAVSKLHLSPHGVLFGSTVFVLAALGLVIAVLWSFVTVHRVVRPRGARYYPSTEKGRDLMWQEHVLLHSTAEAYFSAIRAAPPELILRNYTDQIFELAHISKEKMAAIASATGILGLAFLSWVFLIASSFVLVKHT